MRISDWSSDVFSSDLVYTFVNASERTMPLIQINHELVSKENTLLSVFEQRTRQAIPVEAVVDLSNPNATPHTFRVWLELEPRGTATESGRASCGDRDGRYG